jgi:hypothetical protein
VAVEQFAGQAQRAYRVIGGVAAGGIGQDGELRGRQRVEQVGLAGVLADVGAADCDGDDLGAGSVDGRAGFGEILVLAGADKQAGTVGLSGDGQFMQSWLPRYLRLVSCAANPAAALDTRS